MAPLVAEETQALPGKELTPRHREVLREALHLFAERGYAGASLRELARRVGVSQPSLYHYFKSKDELVEQVLENTAVMFEASAQMTPPSELSAIPDMLASGTVFLYRSTDWRLFVRFLFNLSFSSEAFRPKVAELFVDKAGAALEAMMRPFVERGEIGAEDARHLARMCLNSVALLMIEQTILYPGEPTDEDAEAFARFVAKAARAALPALRKKD